MKMTESGRAAYNNYMKEWRAKNPEKVKDARKKWRENNKDKIAEYQAKYWNNKAQKRDLEAQKSPESATE